MNRDLKKKLVQAVPYGIIWYLADKVGSVYRIAEGSQTGEKLIYTFLHFGDAFTKKLPSFHPQDMIVGLIGALIVCGIVYYRSKNAKKYRQGVEYGSARWGTAADIRPFVDPDPENNIILTQTESLTMNSRSKVPKYARNKNIVVIGDNDIIGLSQVTFRREKAAAA